MTLKLQGVVEHDYKVLNNMIKQLRPTTPIEEARKVGQTVINNCLFYTKKKVNEKQKALTRINELTKVVDIQMFLYNIMLSGEGMKVIK